jgi:outer membrane protein OmpA-like peptidoglycan-associated protein
VVAAPTFDQRLVPGVAARYYKPAIEELPLPDAGELFATSFDHGARSEHDPNSHRPNESGDICMNANLLSLTQEALGGNFSNLAAQFLGESKGATESALGSLLPAVIGSIAQKGATTQGATGLMSLVNGAGLDVSALGNPAALFGGDGAGVNGLLKAGTNSLVPSLFGDKSGAVVNALSSASGIKSSSATTLLAMVVPLVLTFLKKFFGEHGLNANSLTTLLSGQGANLRGALDSRITSALGFSSPSAFLGGLAGQTADSAQRVGAAVVGGAGAAATATRSGFVRWLPGAIGAAVLIFLWTLLSGRSTSVPAVSTVSVATPAALVAVTATLPAEVYFDVGSATIGADSATKIAAAAENIKKDNLKVTLIGYTDRTGDSATNEQLAKSRATAVRDALAAAGVAGPNIDMRPPIFVEIGAAGGDAAARRVEISKQ